MRQATFRFVFVGLIAAVPAVPAVAQESPQGTVQEAETIAETGSARADRLELMRNAAAAYRILLTDEQESTEFVLQPKPLLRWTNPVRRTTDGAVFLWTHKGRPAVVVCMYPNRGALDHEFQSLAEVPLTAQYAESDGALDWRPGEAGVIFRPVPDGPVPAAASAARLSQMRAIARQFRALIGGPRNRTELRLLTQPLYRYSANAAAASDGAVFAFVQGTDPEMLLLLEVRMGTDNQPRWHYAAARMTCVNIELSYQDELVWSAAWHGRFDREKAYVCFSQRTPLPNE